MKNTYSVSALLKISLPVIASDSFVNKKGEAVTIGSESLYAIDYHTLTATAKPFNFAIAKVAREAFAKAIQGEFFARELAKVEAEAAKVAAIDESYFAEARESHTADEIAEARAKVDTMRKRINIARDFITPYARESGNVTIKALVSAIRAEAVPAKLAKAADDMRTEARKIDDIVHTTFAPAEVERARAILANRESYGESIVSEAAAYMAKYDLSEGINETLPNLKGLRESITKYIDSLWEASPAEGIERINFKASHALTVEVFQRARNARSITKAGNVHSTFAAADDIAREAALALVEVLQGKVREAAKAAEAAAAAEAKAAEAKAEAKAEAAREAAEAKAAEAAKAKAEAEAKAAEAEAAAKAAKRKGTKAAEAAKAIKAAAAEAKAEAAAEAEAKAEAAAKVATKAEAEAAAAREAAAK